MQNHLGILSFSARRPQKYVDHFCGTADQRGKYILTGVEDASEWHHTSWTFTQDTCERSRDWKVDDRCPFASHSTTKNVSASTEFGQISLADKEKAHIGELT